MASRGGHTRSRDGGTGGEGKGRPLENTTSQNFQSNYVRVAIFRSGTNQAHLLPTFQPYFKPTPDSRNMTLRSNSGQL